MPSDETRLSRRHSAGNVSVYKTSRNQIAAMVKKRQSIIGLYEYADSFVVVNIKRVARGIGCIAYYFADR